MAYGDDGLCLPPLRGSILSVKTSKTEKWVLRAMLTVALAVPMLAEKTIGGDAPRKKTRWAEATLEVSLAVLESSRSRREVVLAHRIPTNH